METREKARRERGQGSLIQLKNSPYWHARFYAPSGEKISVSTGTANRHDAEDFLREQMEKARTGAPAANVTRKIKYATLRAALLADYRRKGNKSLITRADGEETIMGLKQLDDFFHFSETNSGPNVGGIDNDTAAAFIAARQAEGKGEGVINNSLSCLRRMLSIAYRDKKIATKPFIGLLKPPPARKGFVEPEQFERLLQHLPEHLKAYVIFLYYCGGRSGEAALVEWSQVDLQHRLIRLEPEQTKGDEGREVPLPLRLVEMLEKVEPKEGRVFDTTNLRKEWAKACAAAGLGEIIPVEDKPYDPRYKGITLHDFRRSAARNLLAVGVSETRIMKIGGWKTRSVFDRYAVASTSDLTAAMNRLERAENLLSQKKGYRKGKVSHSTLKHKDVKLLESKDMALSSRG
jgi:integrase